MAARKALALLYSQVGWALLDLFIAYFRIPFVIGNDLQQYAFKWQRLRLGLSRFDGFYKMKSK